MKLSRFYRRVVALAIFGLMPLIADRLEAASTDTLTLSVTPSNIMYGVQITSVTAGVGYNFGTVNLGATTASTKAIAVLNSGNVSEFFVMKVSTTSGGSGNWVPSGAYDAGTPPVDVFELLGLMYANPSTQPSGTVFDNAANLITGIAGVTGANTYNQGSGPKTIPGNTKDLWLKLKMPRGVTVNESVQKTMVLTIIGQSD